MYFNHLFIKKGALLEGDRTPVGPNVVPRFPRNFPLILSPYSIAYPLWNRSPLTRLSLLISEPPRFKAFQGSDFQRKLTRSIKAQPTKVKVTVKGRTSGGLRKSTWVLGNGGTVSSKCRLVRHHRKLGSLSITLEYNDPKYPPIFTI